MMAGDAPIAIGIFAVAYALIITERVHKTVAALLGGTAVMLFGVVSQHDAFAAIDLEVIFLLVGMMIITHFLAESGFFGYLAVRLAQVARGKPVPLMLLLCMVTAVLSALVDNVTTVLLIAPVTFLIAEQLEVPPIPYLIFEVLSANVGGTATLIGDPPNILIGSAAGLSFNQFVIHLGPIALVCLVFVLVFAGLAARSHSAVDPERRARIMRMRAERSITDRKLLVRSSTVLSLVLLAFVLHGVLGFEPAAAALAGAAVLLLWTRADPEEAFRSVEWSTLFFFIGLFMLVAGLIHTGVLDACAQGVIRLTGDSIPLTAMAVLWLSGLASSVVDNIPITVTLIPIVEQLLPELAAQNGVSTEHVHTVLWWSLALGACLGGNGTLYGAAANVVVIGIARRNKQPISFAKFLAYGLPVMILTLALSSAYVFVRYL
jgi:Na+/H+ antiporter NhaD/arsenite permease-like protein